METIRAGPGRPVPRLYKPRQSSLGTGRLGGEGFWMGTTRGGSGYAALLAHWHAELAP